MLVPQFGSFLAIVSKVTPVRFRPWRFVLNSFVLVRALAAFLLSGALPLPFSVLAIPILERIGGSPTGGTTSVVEVQTDASSSDGLTPKRSTNGQWGYVDRNQAYVITPQFESAKRFSEGLAPVELHKKFGFIDTTGRFVIEPKFAFAEPFSEGLALVFPDWGLNFLGRAEGYTLFVRAGYIDHAGKMAVKTRFVENAHSFSDGLAAFQAGTDYTYGQSKWGYLDKSGKWAIEPQFDIATDFSEDLAAVCFGVQGHTRGQWGYIDKQGKLVIPGHFERALPFIKGLAKVRTSKGWRYVDKQGQFVGTGLLPSPGPIAPEGSKPIPR